MMAFPDENMCREAGVAVLRADANHQNY